MSSAAERAIEEMGAEGAAEEAARMRRESAGLLAEPEMIGRFEAHKLPSGDVIYKEQRGENHYYHAEIRPKNTRGDYSFVRGSTLTGVSTAAKHLDGDPTGLMHWSAELNMAGVARIYVADMEAGLPVDWLHSQEGIEARLREMEATWEHERNRRADQGTNVHHETVWKLATTGTADLGDLSEAEQGFGQGVFRSFRELGMLGRVRHAEQVTVHHSNRIAGTFDLWVLVDVAKLGHPNVRGEMPEGLAGLDQARLLLDYKTRDQAGKVRKSDHVQLQGYEDCNRSCGIEETDAQGVLIVLPDGEWELHWCDATPAEWRASLIACRAGKIVDSRMRVSAKLAKEVAAAAEEAMPV